VSQYLLFMSSHVSRLSHLFTPTYARLINAQIVYPAQAAVVKPNELESALARPLQVAHYEPHRNADYLAASLAYGIIKGHPFLDGNKRTAFFLGNEYARCMGLGGMNGMDMVNYAEDRIVEVVKRYVGVAKGEMDVLELSKRNG
jgi:prophage maintenance system killer protein